MDNAHVSAPEIEVLDVNKQVTSSAQTQRKVRIVHISDTHLQHDAFYDQGLIPDGDILIHSGDFDFYTHRRRLFYESDYHRQMAAMNAFFSRLPHKHKIFVAGNHETNLPRHSRDQIQRDLPSAIYLQDSFVDLEGIRIYGAPWTGYRWFSLARSFTDYYSQLDRKWDLIPDDVDVLVTHSPPYGILDILNTPWIANCFRSEPRCELCATTHVNQMHSGSQSLLDTIVNRVK